MDNGTQINTIIYAEKFGVTEELVSEAITETDGNAQKVSAYIEAMREYYIDVIQEWP